MEEMSEAEFEAVRDKFFRVANIDLKCISAGEVRDLLELLPRVQSALFHHYDMGYVFGDEEDE